MSISPIHRTRRSDPDDNTTSALADVPAIGTADPLLEALAQARQRFDQATIEMRILIALGREFTGPRPYTFTQLAQAADMSISGVRTSYGPRELAYLQLILTCGQPTPPFLRAPLTALRHQPSPHLEDGDE
ncbi:hypothetical protein [Spirillospora sp. NPDC047279]|uniref:hypothetical protein n=1 Tax=Spirillospora sp. NPDC047279 TaxID=3155478 RepID=UPI0033D5E0F6